MNRQQKLTFLLRVHAGDAKLSPIDDAFLTAHAKGALCLIFTILVSFSWDMGQCTVCLKG